MRRLVVLLSLLAVLAAGLFTASPASANIIMCHPTFTKDNQVFISGGLIDATTKTKCNAPDKGDWFSHGIDGVETKTYLQYEKEVKGRPNYAVTVRGSHETFFLTSRTRDRMRDPMNSWTVFNQDTRCVKGKLKYRLVSIVTEFGYHHGPGSPEMKIGPWSTKFRCL